MLVRVVIVGGMGSLDRLTYAVPPQMKDRLALGHRVLVPLRSRRVTAIVTEMGDDLDAGGANPKPILELLEPRPLFDQPHLQLVEFLASYYMAPVGEAFRNVIPSLARVESRRLYRLGTAPNLLARVAFTSLERAIVEALSKRPMTRRQLERLGERNQIESAVSHLLGDGWLTVHEGTRGRHREQMFGTVRLTRAANEEKLRGRKQRELAQLLALADPGGVTLDDLEARIPGARKALRAMKTQAIVEFVALQAADRNLGRGAGSAGREADCTAEGESDGAERGESAVPIAAPPPLTAEQAAAVGAVAPAVRERRFEPFLLWGITASGKSEVYLQLAGQALSSGRQVLVLVPEIALADQLVDSFRQRFGVLVAIVHSAQNIAERWASWTGALSGEVRLVIGPRSAIFAPVQDLGLIVVDEEHDAAYKHEEGIRYNARDLAVALGRFGSCPVILGSATPSAESYMNARRGRYRMLQLTRRVREGALPQVEILDLRQGGPTRKEGCGATNEIGDALSASAAFTGTYKSSASVVDPVPLSPALVEALRDNLTQGNQSLVFLNRRGYHSFLQCRLCGNVMTCTNCSVAMTFHLGGRTLRCHYCGASEPAPEKCYQCGGFGLEGQGFGTERVVQALTQMLPSARIARMDSDTSGRRGARAAITRGVRGGEIDILVGTQMITKGFDFPGVTLVVVVLADLALHLPDFRSAERTFQLLTQVAGRAGRGERPGRVLIQTYAPHHYSIRAAREQDFARFIRRELELRRELMYPPFARMALVWIEGEDPTAVRATAAQVAASLTRSAKPETMRVLGPAPSPIERIKRRYRWQVALKAHARADLRAALTTMRKEVGADAGRDEVRISVDIDPMNML